MSDLVKKLRSTLSNEPSDDALWERVIAERQEAADEIERLAAEAVRLREALEIVMVGGNHLATIIGATHPGAGAHYETALQFYGPGHQYDAWCCWNAIMQARALSQKESTP